MSASKCNTQEWHFWSRTTIFKQCMHMSYRPLSIRGDVPIGYDGEKCDCAIQLRNDQGGSKSTSHPKTMMCNA